MRSLFASVLLFLANACSGAHGAPDAEQVDTPNGDAAATDVPEDAGADGAGHLDALIDAPPDYSGLICTGRPVPEGLPCRIQDASAVAPCEGRGAVAFDGTRCRLVRGDECSAAGRGAFDSLEECGVTCAGHGQCDRAALDNAPPDWAVEPSGCGDAPAECLSMRSWQWELIPPDCSVWGAFAAPRVSSSDVPFPEQWDVIWSLTLAADVLGSVTCNQSSL